MEDKLKEQADTFESLVNMKEAEKNALIRDLCQLEEEKRKQSVANEKTVANLEEKNHALKLEIDKQNKEIEEQALELN